MKAWRRARSDMQLFFLEIKKRDKMREEFNTLCEAFEMFSDLIKIHMHLEMNETLERNEVELNQIKFNIMDMIM